MCVQNFDDSRGFAIRITYRISLRSSSLWEPRHPLLKVVIYFSKSLYLQRTEYYALWIICSHRSEAFALEFAFTAREEAPILQTGVAIDSS